MSSITSFWLTLLLKSTILTVTSHSLTNTELLQLQSVTGDKIWQLRTRKNMAGQAWLLDKFVFSHQRF